MDKYNVKDVVENISNKISEAGLNAGNPGIPALLIGIAAGAAVCLFGLRLVKVLTTLMGLLIGAGLGAAVSAGFQLSGITPLIVILACAAVLGAMSFFLYQFGVFLLVLCYGVGISSTFIKPDALLPFVICIVLGVIAAVLAVIYIEPIVIVITGLSGGILASSSVFTLIGMADNEVIMYIGAAAVAVVGITIQFMMHSRKIGKKQKIYSKQVKEKVSRESEVEKARKILEENEEES